MTCKCRVIDPLGLNQVCDEHLIKTMTIKERVDYLCKAFAEVKERDFGDIVYEQIQQACDAARIEQLKVSQAYLETERVKAYEKGFAEAREKAANTIETYRKLSLTNTLVDKDGFLIGLQSIVRALSPEEGEK